LAGGLAAQMLRNLRASKAKKALAGSVLVQTGTAVRSKAARA